MKIAGIHEAKTSLSRLIKAACMGGEIIIARGKDPVVRLVPLSARKDRRKLGILKGKLDVGPEFFEPLSPEELAHWVRKSEEMRFGSIVPIPHSLPRP